MPDRVNALGMIDDSVASDASARSRVNSLADTYGLSNAEIARATEATARTVQRWRRVESSERGSRYDRRVAELIDIAAMVAQEVDDPKIVGQFLRSRNAYLRGARPLNVLGADRYDEVVDALEAAQRGDVPPDKLEARRPTRREPTTVGPGSRRRARAE